MDFFLFPVPPRTDAIGGFVNFAEIGKRIVATCGGDVSDGLGGVFNQVACVFHLFMGDQFFAGALGDGAYNVGNAAGNHALFPVGKSVSRGAPPAAPQKINSGETPCRNGFYAGDPLAVSFRKETAHIPLLIGSTFSEFSGFGLNDYDRKTILDAEAVKAVEEKLGQELADKALPLFRKAYPERNPIDLLGMDYMFRQYTVDDIKRRMAAGCAPIGGSFFVESFGYEAMFCGVGAFTLIAGMLLLVWYSKKNRALGSELLEKA